ncbi:MAG: hypothetical protein GTO14_23030 [Anaerolineales bacterium]|nr:hypothetical protein [Anaerolineales bacterium]
MQKLIGKMASMFPIIAVMGWMIVGISLLIGLLVLSPARVTIFSDAKAVREAASTGNLFVNTNVTSHVMETWVPQSKFLGLGLGLMAIVKALGTIAKRLRVMGFTIMSHIRADLRPTMPPIPGRVRIFQFSTVMGVMILLAALLIGFVLATDVGPSYWNHSIANELPAAEGSALLAQLGLLTSYAKWLNPLRMLGMAFLFTGITIALTVIIGTLRKQAELLTRFYNQVTS